MKSFLIVLFLLIPVMCSAAIVSKVTFWPYSSGTSTTCGVIGYESKNGTHTLKTEYSRNVSIAKGRSVFNSYSTTIGGVVKGFIKFTCVVNGTTTAAPVRVYLNGVQTYFLTTASDTIQLGM